MKAVTIHIMLAQLKSDFVETVSPRLQRKFQLENPHIDMRDCRTLIYEVAAKHGLENVSQDVVLELAKPDMEREADAIMDFVIKEDIFHVDVQRTKMKIKDLIAERDAGEPCDYDGCFRESTR